MSNSAPNGRAPHDDDDVSDSLLETVNSTPAAPAQPELVGAQDEDGDMEILGNVLTQELPAGIPDVLPSMQIPMHNDESVAEPATRINTEAAPPPPVAPLHAEFAQAVTLAARVLTQEENAESNVQVRLPGVNVPQSSAAAARASAARNANQH